MDIGDPVHDHGGFGEDDGRPRELPKDLPRSLNDRLATPQLPTEAEMYDGWQGKLYPPPPPSPLPPPPALPGIRLANLTAAQENRSS